MKRLGLLVIALVALSMALAACGGGEEKVRTVEVEKPVIVEKEVVKEVPVEKQVVVEKEVPKIVEVEKQVEKEVVKEVEKVLPTEPLRVGLMTIRTGSGSGFGIPFDTAQSIAADEFNAKGGIRIGDKRYLVEIEKLDSKWEVPVMLSISEQFVNRRGYKFVFTGGSPMIEVMDPISAPKGVIHMSTTWNLKPCESRYTFCTMATHFETSPKLLEWIRKEQPQVKSVFYIAVNFTFDIGAEGLFHKVADNMGFDYLGATFMEFPITDVTSVATQVLSKKPDMIIIGGLTDEGVPMVRALRQQGFKGILATAYAFPTLEQLMDGLKGPERAYLENYYAVEEVTQTDRPDPDFEALKAEYGRREPGTAQSGLTTAYYNMNILLTAIEKAQSLDTDKIAQTLETIEIPNKFLPGDPLMSFGGAGKATIPLIKRQRHIIWNGMSMNVFRDGRPQTLEVFSAVPTVPLPEPEN